MTKSKRTKKRKKREVKELDTTQDLKKSKSETISGAKKTSTTGAESGFVTVWNAGEGPG